MHVEIKGLEKLRSVLAEAPDNIRTGFDKAIGEVAELIRFTARGFIRSRTGNLASSGYVTHTGLVQYEVGFSAPYAKFVEENTSPHMIYPRRMGGVLRFEVGNEVVFSRYVFHPGTTGQHFLGRASEYSKETLLSTIKDQIKTWLHWSETG